jgi:hypothetical protein
MIVTRLELAHKRLRTGSAMSPCVLRASGCRSAQDFVEASSCLAPSASARALTTAYQQHDGSSEQSSGVGPASWTRTFQAGRVRAIAGDLCRPDPRQRAGPATASPDPS